MRRYHKLKSILYHFHFFRFGFVPTCARILKDVHCALARWFRVLARQYSLVLILSLSSPAPSLFLSVPSRNIIILSHKLNCSHMAYQHSDLHQVFRIEILYGKCDLSLLLLLFLLFATLIASSTHVSE